MKNREIKFRTWYGGKMWDDKEAKRLLYNEGCGVNHIDAYTMQFTGLHDKNGKEIYEGDIMSLLDGTIIATITYNDGSYHFSFDEFEVNPIRQDRAKKWQVIGNIHQHPELLK